MTDEKKLEKEYRMRKQIQFIGLLIWISACVDILLFASRVAALCYGVPAGLGQSVPLAIAAAAALGIKGLVLSVVGWHGMTDPACPYRWHGPISEGSIAVVVELIAQPVLLVHAGKIGSNMILILSFSIIQLLMPIRYRALRSRILRLIKEEKLVSGTAGVR